MPFDLDLSQAQPLLNRVRDVFSPAVADDILLYAGKRVGMAAEQVVQDDLYPTASGKALPLFYTRTHESGPNKGKQYLSKFKSSKQQRLVMALVASGKIPYRRTGTLGKSILSRASAAGEGMVIVAIGSNLSYAPYVIDLLMQSHYHMGTWQPIQTDIQKALPQLTQVAITAVDTDINRRIKGQ